MWMADELDLTPWLVFDLGSTYDLTSASIWQYNYGGIRSLDRGVNGLRTLVSTDGTNFTLATVTMSPGIPILGPTGLTGLTVLLALGALLSLGLRRLAPGITCRRITPARPGARLGRAITMIGSSLAPPVQASSEAGGLRRRRGEGQTRARSLCAGLLVALATLAVAGCAAKRETPPEVARAYEELLARADADAPGALVAGLERFRRDNARYRISATVSDEIKRVRRTAEGRYHLARDLAREGALGRAERILTDLADNLPDTDDGRSAVQYLKFDFPFFKAQQLMAAGDFDEAERTARRLLANRVAPPQSDAIERLLDAIAAARKAAERAAMGRAMSAGQVLRVCLQSLFAERGAYPSQLSFEALELGDPTAEAQVRKALSAIEEYVASGSGFSLVAVGKDGKTRVRVSGEGVEEMRQQKAQ